jgi:hypothetical protein
MVALGNIAHALNTEDSRMVRTMFLLTVADSTREYPHRIVIRQRWAAPTNGGAACPLKSPAIVGFVEDIYFSDHIGWKAHNSAMMRITDF